jgi:hypothetical protein
MKRSITLILGISVFTSMVVGLGSCANYNSNTFDETVYQAPQLDKSDQNFAPAFAILTGQKCIGCHSDFTSLTSSAAWVSARIGQSVIPGNPDDSPLIKKLKNFTPPGNMPPSDSLTEIEYQTLRAWVQNIQ